MELPWALVFIAKILGFVAIVDVAVLPILWIFRVPLTPQAYIPITSYETVCIITIGGLMLLASLFSTIEQENSRYTALGTIRYGLRSKTLTNEQNHDMRPKGILMVMADALLFLPTLIILGS